VFREPQEQEPGLEQRQEETYVSHLLVSILYSVAEGITTSEAIVRTEFHIACYIREVSGEYITLRRNEAA
jgi:hypothetical protein